MRIRTRLYFLLLLMIVFCMPSSAMPADASGAHEAGIAAFEKENYRQALEYFRQAEKQGIETPNLFYNMGVTYYRLGKYSKARDEFLRLTDNPEWRPLALYNIALCKEAKGDRQAAADYYSKARTAAGENSRIGRLAALELEELRPEGPGPVPGQWYAAISASAGYDDNAVLAPDEGFDSISEQGDMFSEFYGFASIYLSGDENDGNRLDVSAFSRLYADETDYNFASVSGGISKERMYSPWQTSFGISGSAEFVGNELFAVVPSFELSGERKFNDFRLKLANRLSWIEARSPYEYLTGLENRFTAKLERRIPRGKIHAGMGFDYNDRDDLRTEDGFFSHSPFRSDIHAGIDFLLSPELTLVFYGQYRKSYYPDKNIPADEKREDDRVLISARGEYKLFEPLDAFVQYSRTDNDSNLSEYSYESNRVMLGLQYIF